MTNEKQYLALTSSKRSVDPSRVLSLKFSTTLAAATEPPLRKIMTGSPSASAPTCIEKNVMRYEVVIEVHAVSCTRIFVSYLELEVLLE